MSLKKGNLMELKKLENKLSALRNEYKSLNEKRLVGSFDILNRYEMEILEIEREVCKLKNEEYAVPVNLGVEIIESPVLISKFGSALLFIVLDKTQTAVLSFDCVELVLFGGLNDEIIESHDLIGRGLGVYGDYIVRNSALMKNLKRKNKIHSNFDEAYWSELDHYLIRTKDGEFSCVAKSFSLNKYKLSVTEAIVSLGAKSIQ